MIETSIEPDFTLTTRKQEHLLMLGKYLRC